MSDLVADTPKLGIPWCPGCDPTRDPCREILETRWCTTHDPCMAGDQDARTGQSRYLSGAGEAGGEDCARLQRLIR